MSRPLEESPYAFTVPALVEAVPARDRVADRARRLGLDLGEELTHDLKLLTGELVANSVMYTKAACVVCVRWTGERLRVEVTDADPTSVTASQALPTDEHGRGLFLVAALATEWGSNSSWRPPDGRTISGIAAERFPRCAGGWTWSGTIPWIKPASRPR